ncbi:MAG TPA: outer membrane beta-barrel protein [Chitinophagaceae bacterium]|nr:outer membrane beta-barrel protein [Chitinophagaceae bacterium]
MKRIFILLSGICFALTGLAQTDTTQTKEGDTIKIGNMVIIKKGKGQRSDSEDEVRVRRRRGHRSSNISTNWGIVDLGFANFKDETNYAAAQASGFLAPNVGEDQFDLRGGKSVNVNVWFFMQRLNVIKHVVNLKYGLGLELNNYRFDDDIKFLKNPTRIILMGGDSTYRKNKLAADYLTVPFMLNFNFTPRREEGFGLSVGVSAGYLYSARQKFKGGPGDKFKEHDDFDLRRWKLSYIGELQLGPVKLYGSCAHESMFDKALDMTPYAVGVRFSNW